MDGDLVMKKPLEVINSLERQGFFSRYAIGGAVATLFYPISPAETEDLHILVLLPPDKAASLDPLADLHRELSARELPVAGALHHGGGNARSVTPCLQPLGRGGRHVGGGSAVRGCHDPGPYRRTLDSHHAG